MKARLLTPKQRRQMIDPGDRNPSISQQCRMLNVNCSTVYYKRQPVKSEDLELMRHIDELYFNTPSSGSRTIRNDLRKLGYKVNRKRVQNRPAP